MSMTVAVCMWPQVCLVKCYSRLQSTEESHGITGWNSMPSVTASHIDGQSSTHGDNVEDTHCSRVGVVVFMKVLMQLRSNQIDLQLSQMEA